MKTISRSLALFFLLLSFSLAASAKCEKACHACSSLRKNSCKVKKMCVTVPARQTDQGFIPEAEIYVRQQGSCRGKKPILLFVHGFAFSSDSFKCQQDGLCDLFDTIAIDMRGFGRSTKTTPKPSSDPNSIDYTYEIWADDIESVLSQLGVEKFIWVGSSIGGNIGVVYSLRYPGQIQKLVLAASDPLVTELDPSCTTPDCQITPTCDWQFPAETLCSLIQIGELVGTIGYEPFLQQFLAPAFYNEPCTSQIQNALDYTVEAFLTTGFEIVMNVSTHAEAEDLRPLLSQITVPTLICYGSIDAVVPPGASIYVHNEIPNSVLVEFVGKGHQLQVTAFTQFNKLLREFVGSCKMPQFIKIFDEGCCVCPEVKPVPFEQC